MTGVIRYTGDAIQLTSAAGYRLRFKQDDIPVQGKVARGVTGMKMEKKDKITEVATESRMHITKRGGKGRR